MGTATAVAATISSGLLYALAFPTTGMRALAWVALAPLFVVLQAGSRRRALVLAWVWTVAATCGLNDWFPRAVSTYYLQSAAVGIGFFLGVTTLTAAPAFMLFALLHRVLARAPAAVAPLLTAAAWTACELVRTRVLGDPWALLGYSQAPLVPLVQVADLAGVYGVSFVVALANAALAATALAWRRPGARRLAPLPVAVVVVLAAFGYGALRLRAFPPPERPTPVVVVQANLDLGSQWRSEFYGRNLEAYMRLTWQTLERTPDARLVVWPESALTFFLDDEPTYRAAIARLLAPTGVELVTGGPRTAGDGLPPFHNAAFLLDADGEIVAWYDKRRLLPFAEYFPLPWLDFLRRSFGRVREFTPGASTPPLPTVAGPAGVVICNEGLFAAPARARVRAGAGYLIALANDSWVSDEKYATQAFEMTRLRAVEQRRWLVRASTSGPSALVDPAGRVTARTDPFREATITGALAARSERTLYARTGDLFALLCAVVALGAALSRALSRGGAR